MKEIWVSDPHSYRPTTDDWSPNFPGNLVAVGFIPLGSPYPNFEKATLWRVCVHGMDDRSMEKDVSSREEAYRVYKSLPVIITFDDLKSRGFVYG